MTLILGLDPGLCTTGWGLIEDRGQQLFYKAHGIIRSDRKHSLGARITQLYEGLVAIITKYNPQEAAVEETFVNMNAASTLKLGMARGVVLLAPAAAGLTIGEYATNRVKKAVVGVGHADKRQVAMMVQKILSGCVQVEADAADALAVAICHAHYRKVPIR